MKSEGEKGRVWGHPGPKMEYKDGGMGRMIGREKVMIVDGEREKKGGAR